MRKLIMPTIIATTAMLGGVAMAQESAGQPIYPSLPQGSYAGVAGSQFAGELGPDGTAVPNVNAGYVPQWSANPGIYNTSTADPSFVEHGGEGSHGH